MSNAERGQSAATNCVQRVAAGVPHVVTAGPHAGVAASSVGPHSEEQAAYVQSGFEGPVCGTTTLETSTREEQLSAAEMLEQVEL